MKRIDSDALNVLTKALGLTGAGSQVTELTDGIVDQTLDVVPIIRRGRTLAGTGGIFTTRMRNTHPGADSRTSLITPYLAGTAAAAPYPSPMPEQFDVWLIDAMINQLSGTGTLSAAMQVNYPAAFMGISTIGPASQAISTHTMAQWDALITEDTTFAILIGSNGPRSVCRMRLPRSPTTEIVFASTSSAVATFEMVLTLGVFPVALGQDVL